MVPIDPPDPAVPAEETDRGPGGSGDATVFNREYAHAAMTRTTRLAQRMPEATQWLEQMVAAGVPDTIGPAVDVALETGVPMPAVLQAVVRSKGGLDVAEELARHVPVHASSLIDVAITATQMLLDDPGWPAEVDEREQLVRRHALRIAMGRRYLSVGRTGEARVLIEEAIVGLEDLAVDSSGAWSRLVDALDALVDLVGMHDPATAVKLSRRALDIRSSIDDPYRTVIAGRVRLGIAMLIAGQAQDAMLTLTAVVAELAQRAAAGDQYRALDRLMELGKVTIGGIPAGIRMPVNMGYLPNGFDELIIDYGPTAAHLRLQLLNALPALAAALERVPSAPEEALMALDDGREALRGDGLFTDDVEIVALEALVRWRVTARNPPDVPAALRLARELGRVAEEATGLGDGGLAHRAFTLQEDCLRAGGTEGSLDLVRALGLHAQLLASMGYAAEGVELAREALAVSEQHGEVEGWRTAMLLHNLSRRLGTAGRPAEAVPLSARAVELIASAYLSDPKVERITVGPGMFADMLLSLVNRANEAKVEVPVGPVVEEAVLKLLHEAAGEPAAVIMRLWQAVAGVIDSATRTGRLTTALRAFTGLRDLARARPDYDDLQVAYGFLASMLVWKHVSSGDLAAARSFYEDIAAAVTRVPSNSPLRVEQGKSATDLMAAYQARGDHMASAQIAADALDTLRSPEYLAARARDLGEDPEQFVAAVEAIAAAADTSSP